MFLFRLVINAKSLKISRTCGQRTRTRTIVNWSSKICPRWLQHCLDPLAYHPPEILDIQSTADPSTLSYSPWTWRLLMRWYLGLLCGELTVMWQVYCIVASRHFLCVELMPQLCGELVNLNLCMASWSYGEFSGEFPVLQSSDYFYVVFYVFSLFS